MKRQILSLLPLLLPSFLLQSHPFSADGFIVRRFRASQAVISFRSGTSLQARHFQGKSLHLLPLSLAYNSFSQNRSRFYCNTHMPFFFSSFLGCAFDFNFNRFFGSNRLFYLKTPYATLNYSLNTLNLTFQASNREVKGFPVKGLLDIFVNNQGLRGIMGHLTLPIAGFNVKTHLGYEKKELSSSWTPTGDDIKVGVTVSFDRVCKLWGSETSEAPFEHAGFLLERAAAFQERKVKDLREEAKEEAKEEVKNNHNFEIRELEKYQESRVKRLEKDHESQFEILEKYQESRVKRLEKDHEFQVRNLKNEQEGLVEKDRRALKEQNEALKSEKQASLQLQSILQALGFGEEATTFLANLQARNIQYKQRPEEQKSELSNLMKTYSELCDSKAKKVLLIQGRVGFLEIWPELKEQTLKNSLLKQHAEGKHLKIDDPHLLPENRGILAWFYELDGKLKWIDKNEALVKFYENEFETARTAYLKVQNESLDKLIVKRRKELNLKLNALVPKPFRSIYQPLVDENIRLQDELEREDLNVSYWENACFESREIHEGLKPLVEFVSSLKTAESNVKDLTDENNALERGIKAEKLGIEETHRLPETGGILKWFSNLEKALDDQKNLHLVLSDNYREILKSANIEYSKEQNYLLKKLRSSGLSDQQQALSKFSSDLEKISLDENLKNEIKSMLSHIYSLYPQTDIFALNRILMHLKNSPHLIQTFINQNTKIPAKSPYSICINPEQKVVQQNPASFQPLVLANAINFSQPEMPEIDLSQIPNSNEPKKLLNH